MNTPVVNTAAVSDVDPGTHTGHYGCVNTLKERLRWVTEVQVNKLLGQSDPDTTVRASMILALAEAAGVAPSWLAWGIGSPDDDPPLPTLLMRLRKLPGLEQAIERHPGRWRTSTIARATSETFQCDSSGVPLGGWEKALDSIESGLSIRTRGDAGDVTRATSRQVGRRPKLPKRS